MKPTQCEDQSWVGHSKLRPLPSKRLLEVGFSLMEVMVAVAILAISLSSVFSTQVGNVRAVERSNYLTLATNLVRCKMGEIEEQIAMEGFPLVKLAGVDSCCEAAPIEGFKCDWSVDRIVLPDDLGVGDEEEGAEGEDEEDPFQSLVEEGEGVSDDFVSDMAMQYAFPVLKPTIEEQVRRATVTVEWSELGKVRSFDVVQFLVAEQPPPLPEAEEEVGDS